MSDEVEPVDTSGSSGDETPPAVVPPAATDDKPPAADSVTETPPPAEPRNRRATDKPPAGDVDYDKLAETMESRAKAREEAASREAEVKDSQRDDPPSREHWFYRKRGGKNRGTK